MNKTLQLVSSLEAIKTVTQGENTRERSFDVVASKQHTQLYSGIHISFKETKLKTLQLRESHRYEYQPMKTLYHSVINNYIYEYYV
jgi:hypothetical protein